MSLSFNTLIYIGIFFIASEFLLEFAAALLCVVATLPCMVRKGFIGYLT